MPETRFIQRKIKYIVHRVLFILLGLLACDNAFGQGSQNWCNGITSDVSIPDTAYCLGIGLTLTNSTSDTHALAVTHSWNFNGESSSADSLPVFTFTTPGTKQIYYSATNSHGCQVFDTLEVDIVKYYPHISVNDVSQCLSTNEFDLSDSSYSFPTGFQSASRNWVLTGHQSSTDSSFSYTYSVDSNEYAVKLTTVNTLGCVADTTLYVNVNPMPKMAVSYIDSALCFYGSASDTFKVVENATVEITNNSTSTISSYEWQYGSDISTNDTLFINPTGVGTNTFLFIAETSDGCKDTLEGSFSYYKQPTAVFTVNDTAQCLDLHAFEFIDASTSNLSNASLTYAWSFGDGTTSASADPTKVYGTAGRREVELIVTNNQGCTDTANETITTAPNPVMNFTIDDDKQCENQNEFTFTNTSSLSLGGTLSYEWISPDGHTASSTNYTRKIYLDDNTYGVKLIATSSYGCKDSATKNITLDAKPVALISNTSADSCLNSLWYFKVIDLSAATMKSQSWTFPDASTSIDSLVQYSFQSNGSKTLSVIIENDNSCFDTTDFDINVYTNPVAGFDFDDSTQCFDIHRFKLSNTTTHSASTISYSWNFGDSSSTITANPTKVFNYTGYKNITLIATDNYGCADTIEQEAFVVPHPISDFNIPDNQQCENHNLFIFKNASTVASNAGTLSSSWDFGDGSSTTGDSVSYNYATTTGIVTVIHTATSSYGCTDTSQGVVHIQSGPSADFVMDTVLYCIRGNVHGFTDASGSGEGSNDTYV
ncbi:MAG: PKD domain-containing protein, partial [Bacteroidia bacterium]|nr:PKD domain-containing protein [Bacteroidia bacterium]